MLRDDVLYDYVIVLDWNISSRKRNCGSAIFFHVAKPGYPSTQGCIAISRQDMMRLLPLISNKTVVEVV
jgi:L,D-peptidoglycan transpeptidase YkuD (ErfK/YbiS/YcfS/YnhG family)